MDRNWRPPNWENPYVHSNSVQAWDTPEGYGLLCSDNEYLAYEAGASAIISAVEAEMLRRVGEWLQSVCTERKMLNEITGEYAPTTYRNVEMPKG